MLRARRGSPDTCQLVGYDIDRRHDLPLGGRFLGHLDLPRIKEGFLDGAMWSITTNPFRTARGRARTLEKNLRRLRGLIDERECLEVVSTAKAYHAARARGVHGCFLAIQGGNALSHEEAAVPLPDPDLVRVTLVHLTPSFLGGTSTPIPFVRKRGLTEAGRGLVRRLDAHRVFVDLAHIHPQGFWDAVEVHDPSKPLLVTHTGPRLPVRAGGEGMADLPICLACGDGECEAIENPCNCPVDCTE